MGEINASAKNDIVKDFRNRNDEMLAKTVKVCTLIRIYANVRVFFLLFMFWFWGGKWGGQGCYR